MARTNPIARQALSTVPAQKARLRVDVRREATNVRPTPAGASSTPAPKLRTVTTDRRGVAIKSECVNEHGEGWVETD
jgi:hypothetical protein